LHLASPDEQSRVKLCGRARDHEASTLSYLSYGSTLTLVLRTDRSVAGAGFKLHYTVVPQEFECSSAVVRVSPAQHTSSVPTSSLTSPAASDAQETANQHDTHAGSFVPKNLHADTTFDEYESIGEYSDSYYGNDQDLLAKSVISDRNIYDDYYDSPTEYISKKYDDFGTLTTNNNFHFKAREEKIAGSSNLKNEYPKPSDYIKSNILNLEDQNEKVYAQNPQVNFTIKKFIEKISNGRFPRKINALRNMSALSSTSSPVFNPSSSLLVNNSERNNTSVRRTKSSVSNEIHRGNPFSKRYKTVNEHRKEYGALTKYMPKKEHMYEIMSDESKPLMAMDGASSTTIPQRRVETPSSEAAEHQTTSPPPSVLHAHGGSERSSLIVESKSEGNDHNVPVDSPNTAFNIAQALEEKLALNNHKIFNSSLPAREELKASNTQTKLSYVTRKNKNGTFSSDSISYANSADKTTEMPDKYSFDQFQDSRTFSWKKNLYRPLDMRDKGNTLFQWYRSYSEEPTTTSVLSKPYSNTLKGLNFPLRAPHGVIFTRHLVAPVGHTIQLWVPHLGSLAMADASCYGDYVEIEDFYAKGLWRICSSDKNSKKLLSIRSKLNSIFIREVRQPVPLMDSKRANYCTNFLQKDPSQIGDVGKKRKDGFSPDEMATRARPISENYLKTQRGSLSKKQTSRQKRSQISKETNQNTHRKIFRKKGKEKAKKYDFMDGEQAVQKTAVFSKTEIPRNQKSLLHFPSLVRLPSEIKSKNLQVNNELHNKRRKNYQNPEHKLHSKVRQVWRPEQSGSPQSDSWERNDKVGATIGKPAKNYKNLNQRTKRSPIFDDSKAPKSSASIDGYEVTFEVKTDPLWLSRSLASDATDPLLVASCSPSPCLNGGSCTQDASHAWCHCKPGYSGIFCQVSACMRKPCSHGECQLPTKPVKRGQIDFICLCATGWEGLRCEQRVSPCENNPCKGRGTCSVISDVDFKCTCHAWWEGKQCERRMTNIPYKPLSERMIEEPFWLGLITVAVVLTVIGIAFCIKKQFAEKIEKFFADEIEKSKYGTSSYAGHYRMGGPLPSPTGLSPRTRPKSLFVRLNSFRKASLLSLSSTASSPHDVEMLGSNLWGRPTGSRPSPAATPKKNLLQAMDVIGATAAAGAAGGSCSEGRSQTASPRSDHRKLLRQLISPAGTHRAPSCDELLLLRSRVSRCSVASEDLSRLGDPDDEEPHVKARTRSADMTDLVRCRRGISETSLCSLSPFKGDPKKVTFARLLSKLTKETSSSSSDMSALEERRAALQGVAGPSTGTGAALPLGRRSPRRSPRLVRATCRHSGSGSEDVGGSPEYSSSEMTPDPPKRLQPPPKATSKITKISSVDSLLAMFKSLGAASHRASLSTPSSPHGSEMEDSSGQCSPSTTPTTPPRATLIKQVAVASGQQISAAGASSGGPSNGGGSATNSLAVPLQVQVHGPPGPSSLSGPAITLEVPTEQYRCLSPITELPSPMPTPMPSPLPTPSKQRQSQRRANSTESSTMNNTADETESEASVTIERTSSDASASDARVFFRSFGIHKNDKPRSNIPLVVPKLVLNLSSPGTSPVGSPASSPKLKTRPPPLVLCDSTFSRAPNPVPVISVQNENGETLERFDSTPRQRSQSIDVGSMLNLPSITISTANETPPSTQKNNPGHSFDPPVFTITCASPRLERRNSNPQQISENMRFDRGPTINVAYVPPMYNKNSDPESPHPRTTGLNPNLLSPFLGATGSHMTSESNLSSSGYSSAYSPGPSRCNSNNPLFSIEADDKANASRSLVSFEPLNVLSNYQNTKPSFPSQASEQFMDKAPKITSSPTLPLIKVDSVFGRTDSETTDEPQTSQPDSALDVDTYDEPESEGPSESHSIKENTNLKTETNAQRKRATLSSSHSFPKETPKLQRCSPTIVVHKSLQRDSSLEEYLMAHPLKLSPGSSRSESPISDNRLSVHKMNPSFFNTSGKRELPYTDSDGLYDCPSSEILNSDCHRSQPNLRRPGRRKMKKSSLKMKTGSKMSHRRAEPETFKRILSEGPSLEPPQSRSSRRISPKRRARTLNKLDIKSSSDESLSSWSLTGNHTASKKIAGSKLSKMFDINTELTHRPATDTSSDADAAPCKYISTGSKTESKYSEMTFPRSPTSIDKRSLTSKPSSTATLCPSTSRDESSTSSVSEGCWPPIFYADQTKLSSKAVGEKILIRSDVSSKSTLTRQNSIDASGEDTQEDHDNILQTCKQQRDLKPRKLNRMRYVRDQLRLYRRFVATPSSRRRRRACASDSNSDVESDCCETAAPSGHLADLLQRPKSN
ncbi:EGF-like domain, partial [Trinorchestia longiramus]